MTCPFRGVPYSIEPHPPVSVCVYVCCIYVERELRTRWPDFVELPNDDSVRVRASSRLDITFDLQGLSEHTLIELSLEFVFTRGV